MKIAVIDDERPARRELIRQIQEVVDNYENSTSWRVTKPLRAMAGWFRR